MNAPRELLAKSPRGLRTLTIERHVLDTEGAASRLFALDKRWGQSFCRFFRIAEPQRERFLLHLRVAALLHDVGKANQDFYDAVTKPGSVTQTLRHEHLSALVLHLPEVRGWLAQNHDLDLEVITAAVLSHHIKAADGGDDWKWCAPAGGTSMALFLQHPEVTRILGRVAALAKLSGVPTLPAGPWSPAPPWGLAWRAGKQAAAMFGRAIRADPARRSLLLAIKAGVIVADSVASGLVREGHDIGAWIDDVAHAAPIGPEDIERAILAPRAAQICEKKGSFKYHRFQLAPAHGGLRYAGAVRLAQREPR